MAGAAARWYLVAFVPAMNRWRVMRLDQLTPCAPTHTPFERRPIPHDDPVSLVMNTHDRGDVAAEWQCRGSALIALPAPIVARFAPAGSTVEHCTEDSCRLSLGAWSWAGIAGLFLTFDANISEIEPLELRQAMRSIRDRIDRGVGA